MIWLRAVRVEKILQVSRTSYFASSAASVPTNPSNNFTISGDQWSRAATKIWFFQSPIYCGPNSDKWQAGDSVLISRCFRYKSTGKHPYEIIIDEPSPHARVFIFTINFIGNLCKFFKISLFIAYSTFFLGNFVLGIEQECWIKKVV